MIELIKLPYYKNDYLMYDTSRANFGIYQVYNAEHSEDSSLVCDNNGGECLFTKGVIPFDTLSFDDSIYDYDEGMEEFFEHLRPYFVEDDTVTREYLLDILEDNGYLDAEILAMSLDELKKVMVQINFEEVLYKPTIALGNVNLADGYTEEQLKKWLNNNIKVMEYDTLTKKIEKKRKRKRTLGCDLCNGTGKMHVERDFSIDCPGCSEGYE